MIPIALVRIVVRLYNNKSKNNSRLNDRVMEEGDDDMVP